MNVIGVMNVYNEANTIALSVQSLLDSAGCSEVIVVDGAYELFPTEYVQESDDGTWEILQSMAGRDSRITVVPPPKGRPWANQVEKRNEYLSYVDDGTDWVVILDGDEILVANQEKFHHVLDQQKYLIEPPALLTIPHTQWIRGRTGNLARILRYHPDVHYHVKHGILHDKDCHLLTKYQFEMNCAILHTDVRPEERRAQHNQYERMMIDRGYIEPGE